MTVEEAALFFGAQMYLPWPGDPSNQTPQMFYRWRTTLFNDKTVCTRLQYLTLTNSWHFSSRNDHERFAEEELIQIPGVAPYDRFAEEARLREFREKLDTESDPHKQANGQHTTN